jgi:hypothetical protein
VVVVKLDSQCCGVEPSGLTTKQPNGYQSGVCSKCLLITEFNERPNKKYISQEASLQERLNSIDDKLDRIEQLVMQFWDVPDSGYNEIQIEESSSIEK